MGINYQQQGYLPHELTIIRLSRFFASFPLPNLAWLLLCSSSLLYQKISSWLLTWKAWCLEVAKSKGLLCKSSLANCGDGVPQTQAAFICNNIQQLRRFLGVQACTQFIPILILYIVNYEFLLKKPREDKGWISEADLTLQSSSSSLSLSPSWCHDYLLTLWFLDKFVW